MAAARNRYKHDLRNTVLFWWSVSLEPSVWWPWAEKNQGLGGWLGAILAVVAIFAAYLLARYEYRRDRRDDDRRHNALIDLIAETTENYEGLVRSFILAASAAARAGSAMHWNFVGFLPNLANHHTLRAMHEVATIPLLQWPSTTAYLTFRQYWEVCRHIEGQSALPGPYKFTLPMLKQRDDALSAFTANLEASRRP